MKMKLLFTGLMIMALLVGCSSSKAVSVAMVEVAQLKNFSMYVTIVETDTKLSKKLAGQNSHFLYFYIRATNISNESHTIDSSMFTLKNDEGKTYKPITQDLASYERNAFSNKQFSPDVEDVGMVIFEVSDSIKVTDKTLPGFYLHYENEGDKATFNLSERIGKLTSEQ
jgi:hypothetical protein